MNPPLDPNDPNTWPIVDAVPTDIFLGEFAHDCAPYLTDEQKTWPVVQCEPTDVFLGVFTETYSPEAVAAKRARLASEAALPPADQAPPSHP